MSEVPNVRAMLRDRRGGGAGGGGGGSGGGSGSGDGDGGDVPDWLVMLINQVVERYLVMQLADAVRWLIGWGLVWFGAATVAYLLTTGQAALLLDRVARRAFRTAAAGTNRRRTGRQGTQGPTIVELEELEEEDEDETEAAPGRGRGRARRALGAPPALCKPAQKRKKRREDEDDDEPGCSRGARKTRYSGGYSQML